MHKITIEIITRNIFLKKTRFYPNYINSIHQKTVFFKILSPIASNKQQFFDKSLFWRENYDILYTERDPFQSR